MQYITKPCNVHAKTKIAMFKTNVLTFISPAIVRSSVNFYFVGLISQSAFYVALIFLLMFAGGSMAAHVHGGFGHIITQHEKLESLIPVLFSFQRLLVKHRRTL